jgi:hypothetical protein
VIRNKKDIKTETPQGSATETFLREHRVSFSKIIFDPLKSGPGNILMGG